MPILNIILDLVTCYSVYPYSWLPVNNFIPASFSSDPSKNFCSAVSYNLFFNLTNTKYKSFTKCHTDDLNNDGTVGIAAYI